MMTIIGEVLKNDVAVNSAKRQLNSYSSEAFIHVLVEICYELNVGTPIWTLAEERLLERNKAVLIPLDNGEILKILMVKNG